MTHVFISYSKKNRAYARTLADYLLNLGFDVWIDDRIDFGEMWERTIFKAIDDCSAFLVIMTPESYESDWVLREIQYADRRHKPQFPVLLDGEDFPRYGPHQHVDVRGGILPPEDFYQRLEKSAPRKAKAGTNVTPQDVAVPQTDTLPAIAAAGVAGQPRKLNTRVIAAISVGILALLVIGLVLLNRPSKAETQIQTIVVETATLRQEIAQLSADLTAEATRQVDNLPTSTVTNTLTLTHTTSPTPSPIPTATSTASPTLTRTPTQTPTVDIEMAVKTLDAEATIHVHETNQAATSTERAAQTATAASWTDTPTSTATLTPNITASIEAFLTQRAAQTATAFEAFQTATADTWTDTPTPTATFTNTATLTPTATNTSTPTPTPTALGGGAGQIVFNSERDGIGQIYVMNTDGSYIRRITSNVTDHNHPSWSPDGSQIAFDSYLAGNYEIYVMNADGSNLKRLTQNSATDSRPSWSPDGQKLAFASNRNGNSEIYIINADGSNELQLTNITKGGAIPKWSPNGQQIAFGFDPFHSSEIYIVNTDGTDQHNLTKNRSDDNQPEWSPDGRQIAFTSKRDGNYEIYIMNADGSSPHNISNNPASDNDPNWRFTAPVPDPLLIIPVIENTQPSVRTTSTQTTVQTSNGALARVPVVIRITADKRINIHSGPDSSYSIVGGLNPDTTWTALEISTNNGWVKIYDHEWISSNYVSVVSGDYNSLPRGNQ